ncbi:MAG TPA: peptide deformylase [Syntrophales bacterium]|nr:peptide deformylase [Syntrophales bacterium]
MTKNTTWQLWRDGKMIEEEGLLLRKKAADLPVPFNAAAKKDIQTLVDAFLKRDDALGLAAPQIGISKRIIAFKVKDFDKKGVSGKDSWEVLINARITQLRGEPEVMNEGCLSCPDISVEVTRATEIKVKAVDLNGNKVNKRYTGFLARIVQHEIDHLDGRLVIDHDGAISYPKEKQEFFEKLFK